MSVPSSEQWRPIPGYEGFYEASDQGHVRSVDRLVTFRDGRQQLFRGQPISTWRSSKGYILVRLS